MKVRVTDETFVFGPEEGKKGRGKKEKKNFG